MIRGAFDQEVTFRRAAVAVDDYGQEVIDPNAEPVTVAEEWARVRFGPAGEKREAAQENASQAATFEFRRTDELDGLLMTDTLNYDGSDWNITELAPLSRMDFRVTAVRSK